MSFSRQTGSPNGSTFVLPMNFKEDRINVLHDEKGTGLTINYDEHIYT